MTIYFEGEIIEFTAQRPCALHGRKFAEGQTIRIELARNWSNLDGAGQGGPWMSAGGAGYTSKTLRGLSERSRA